ARAAWRRAGGRAARWRRLAVAALRQSQGRWLMEVCAPLGLESAVGALPAASARWLGDPGGRFAGEVAAPGSGAAVGAVGPAGGFDGSERTLLEGGGFQALRLSAGRLRTETAALCWACWWASGSAPDQGPPPRSGGGAGL
ncbi:MAG: RNA methyltransferase, partial [Candidatus Eisenbacteria bacterium]|nr:RNA methyltransferase [Candidatus Eisenbacteria bacterium]